MCLVAHLQGMLNFYLTFEERETPGAGIDVLRLKPKTECIQLYSMGVIGK